MEVVLNISEIDASGLNAWLKSGKQVRLVDVRSPAEMAQGMIPDAEQLPLHLLPLQIDQFKDDEVITVFYCRTGARSAQACAFTMDHGNHNVHNLRGGIIAWVRSGLPVAA